MVTFDRNNEILGKKRRFAKPEPSPPAAEKDESEVRWLISYSDFMMQLVCLFILLYSVSSIDTSKAIPLAQAWRDQAGIGEVRVPSAPNTLNAPLTFADVPVVTSEVDFMVGRFPGGGHIRVIPDAAGFRLVLAYEMFDVGSDRLNREGARVMDLAAMILKPYQKRVVTIEIIGHASADESGALPLSLNRAQEALRWMTRPDAVHRLDAGSLLAAGRGAHEPAADNLESAGRALNRRVEFAVRVQPGP